MHFFFSLEYKPNVNYFWNIRDKNRNKIIDKNLFPVFDV